MRNKQYKGRGIHNKTVYGSLLNGNLRKMLDVIAKLDYLDVQIRNNYLNIYYDGGNIAKVSSESSVVFDEKYFCLKNQTIDIKKRKKELVEKFKSQDYEGYFLGAKQAMDKWFAEHPNPERNEQHQLAIENRYLKSDYTIVDVEYQVSMLSEFTCEFTPAGKENPKRPRFDIIAINRQGVVCVIELKKGGNALKSTSGLQEHWECYKHSIERNHTPFIGEISRLLKQKQELGLIDKAVKITDSTPLFMFAYAYNGKTPEKEQRQSFLNEYNKIGVKIPILWIKKGSHKLFD